MTPPGVRGNLNDRLVQTRTGDAHFLRLAVCTRLVPAMMTLPRPLLLALALAACGKSSSSKTAGVELFGKTPVPPGDLAKVKAGMTQAEVKALFPGIKPTPNHGGSPSLSLASGYSNADYRIIFFSDKDEVADAVVEVPKDLAAKLETAWGQPTEKGMFPTWVNDDAGYEASLLEMGRETQVRFRPFVPLSAEFFGAKPAPVDVLTKVKLGMTRDEIAKAAPGFEAAGASKGNGSYVSYLAKPKGVTISIGYDDQDKAEQYIIELPKRGGERVVKAWGPRPGKSRGLGSPMNCWDGPDGTLSERGATRRTYPNKDRGLCEVQ